MDPDTIVVASRPAYTATAMAFHWLTAALMAAILPIAWVMTNMGDDNAWSGLLYTTHKSLGLTIVAIVVLRLAWRASHPAPPRAGRARAGGAGRGPTRRRPAPAAPARQWRRWPRPTTGCSTRCCW